MMDQGDAVHIRMEYFTAIKKEGSHAICRSMAGPRDDPTDRGESEEGKYITYM